MMAVILKEQLELWETQNGHLFFFQAPWQFYFVIFCTFTHHSATKMAQVMGWHLSGELQNCKKSLPAVFDLPVP